MTAQGVSPGFTVKKDFEPYRGDTPIQIFSAALTGLRFIFHPGPRAYALGYDLPALQASLCAA